LRSAAKRGAATPPDAPRSFAVAGPRPSVPCAGRRLRSAGCHGLPVSQPATRQSGIRSHGGSLSAAGWLQPRLSMALQNPPLVALDEIRVLRPERSSTRSYRFRPSRLYRGMASALAAAFPRLNSSVREKRVRVHVCSWPIRARHGARGSIHIATDASKSDVPSSSSVADTDAINTTLITVERIYIRRPFGSSGVRL